MTRALIRRLSLLSTTSFVRHPAIITTAAAFAVVPAPARFHCSQNLASFGHHTFHPVHFATTACSCSSTARRMSSSTNNDSKSKPIVQYIVLRRDLEWPAGAMAAQAAHASVAAIAQALDAQSADATLYISPSNLPHMTKYVYGVDTLEELHAVRDAWKEQVPLPTPLQSQLPQDEGNTGEVQSQPQSQPEGPFYWWVEQPENIPTAFATWPIERTNKISKVVKNMKLTFF